MTNAPNAGPAAPFQKDLTLTLVVLAAGLGRRYGGLKQIDSFGPHQERILDYSVYDAIRAGFTRVVFVIRREIEPAFRRVFSNRFEHLVDVAFAYQDTQDLPEPFICPSHRKKPWGTAHALWSARQLVSGPFAVINADDFYGPSGYHQLASFLRQNATAKPCFAMIAYALARTLSSAGYVARGICLTDRDGFLSSVTEVPKLRITPSGDCIEGMLPDGSVRSFDPDTLVSLNFWAFTPVFLAQLEYYIQSFLNASVFDPEAECYLPSAVDRLLRNKTASVRVLQSPDKWMGVTYPEDREPVAQGLRDRVDAGAYPSPLWG